MKKKIIVGVLTLNLLGFMSCIRTHDFYDYTGISLYVNNPVVAVNDSLAFSVNYEGKYYLASGNGLNAGNAAYAIDFDEGSSGPKFETVRLSITSSTDFDEAHPAGTELKDLIYLDGFDTKGSFLKGNLDTIPPSEIKYYRLFLKERPETEGSHRITVEIEKSDGAVYSDTTEEIKWD